MAEEAANGILARATKRLVTARACLEGGDPEGGFAAAYDADRMAAESLLIRQALRATSDDGSHVTVEDAVSAQFVGEVPAFAKPTYERFRRTRHAVQDFDPRAPEIGDADAAWAVETATMAVAGTQGVSDSGRLPVFSL